MRKIVCVLLIVLLAMATTASATRVTTMGGVNNIVKDVRNIFTYPQLITQYPDAMYLEISGSNLYRAGGHYALGNGVLGMYFSTETFELSSYAPVVDPGGMDLGTYHQRIYLFYGTEMGDMYLGGQLSLFGDAHNVDASTPDDKSAESVMGLGLNIGATFGEKIDAYFTFQNVSWTNEDAAGKMITEPNGNMTIGLGARMWLEMSDTYTLIPYAGFGMMGDGRKISADTSEVKLSGTAITIGVGNNIAASEDVLVVSDLGVRFESGKEEWTYPDISYEGKGSFTSLPYFRIGMEAQLYDWLWARMGAYKAWQKESTEDNDGNTEYWGYANTSLYLGAGFLFKNLHIDAQVNPGFMTRGPYIVSGSGGDMFSQVTIYYVWGEK